MIDVIIPVYNSRKTLKNALCSIVAQTILKELNIYIIDDYSSESYEDILEPFYKICNIIYIKLDENKGPAFARQVGINSSNSEYITFIDSDDIYLVNYFLEENKSVLDSNKDIYVTVSGFYEELDGKNKWKEIKKEFVHIFAKIFRRDFIVKNNIVFPNFRKNEDVGFCTLVLAYLNKNNVFHDDNCVYLWKKNKDSITRKMDKTMYFGDNYITWAENKIWAFERKDVPQTFIDEHSLMCLFTSYYFYNNIIDYSAGTEKQVIQSFRKLYKKYAKKSLLRASEDLKGKIFYKSVSDISYIKVPSISFNEYIKRLDK